MFLKNDEAEVVLLVKKGKIGVLEEGELDNSIKILSSSDVIKDNSLFTKNKSLVEELRLLTCSGIVFKPCAGKL